MYRTSSTQKPQNIGLMQIQSKHANKHVPSTKQLIEKRKIHEWPLLHVTTCMLLKWKWWKSLEIVLSTKKNSCWGFRRKKKFLQSENPPYPITFLKKVYFLLLHSGVGQFFWATQFLPLICSLFLLRESLCIIFFGAFSLCRDFVGNCPPPPPPTPSPS